MADPEYDRPRLDQARKEIDVLFAAYMAATGLAPTFVSMIVTAGGEKALRGDQAFLSKLWTKDFGHAIYDRVNSRFSALWPSGEGWPPFVPRQAPAKIEAETLKLIASTLAAKAARAASEARKKKLDVPLHAGWPAGQPWPADIPRPPNL